MTQGLHVRLTKTLDSFQLDCELSISQTGITAIYGPSGSGKTTLLRCISGLESAQGVIKLGDMVWQDKHVFVPPHERSIAYVFQDGRLFPHLNVRQNIEYGFHRTRAESRQISIQQVIDWLGIAPLLERNVQTLSGGEQQRVAIARALAKSPKLLLMDEPLSALDTASKQHIMPYLETLHQTLAIPVLYVSHTMEEITRLADHLILFEKGEVLASGALKDVLTQADQSIHHTDDTAVVVNATITERDERWHLLKADFGGAHVWLKDQGEALGKSVRLRLFARDLSLSLEPSTDQSILNILRGEVDSIFESNHPAIKLVRVSVGGDMLLARVTSKSLSILDIKPGLKIWVQVKSAAVVD